MFLDGEKVILEAEYRSSRFLMHYDQENNVLHVLDYMKDDKGRRSVTNSIEGILKEIEKKMNLHPLYRVFLYGTDNYIFEYHSLQDGFRYIPKTDKSVLPVFLEGMEYMYK